MSKEKEKIFKLKKALRKGYKDCYDFVLLRGSLRTVDIERVLYRIEEAVFGETKIHDEIWNKYKSKLNKEWFDFHLKEGKKEKGYEGFEDKRFG